MFSLHNKVAIVTGAALGLGRDIAILYAKQGAKVVAADYNQEALDKFMQELSADLTISPFLGDISDLNDVQSLFSHAESEFGAVDIVVNNAGVMDKFDPVGKLDDAVFDRVININLRGTFYMMREAIRVFEPQKKGVIVNIASVAGVEGGRAGAAYTASKHAIVGLTKNTGHAYAKAGIRCNVIAPGGMKTSIMSNIDLASVGKLVKMMFATQGTQKTADPLEVANVALFLASDEASFVNGAVIVADGGWSAY